MDIHYFLPVLYRRKIVGVPPNLSVLHTCTVTSVPSLQRQSTDCWLQGVNIFISHDFSPNRRTELVTHYLLGSDKLLQLVNTLLSRRNAHGCSQLKHQKLRVNGCMEETFEWFNYPCTSTHEFQCQGVPNWPVSLFHLYFVEASLTVEKALHARRQTNP